MTASREKIMVGLFVVVAGGLLFGAALAISGGFGVSRVSHRSYFKFAGGLQAGAAVRYGGLSVGKVDRIRVAPDDATRIQVDFSVDKDTPVSVDSVARITSLGLLSDNYLEISPGARNAARAAPGSIIKSKESFGIDDIADAIGTLLPDLHQTLAGLQTTIHEANDLLNDRNRANIGETLNNLNGTLAETRPKIGSTLNHLDQILADAQPKISTSLTNVQELSAKLTPLLDDLKKTIKTTDDTLSHVDGTLTENRADLKASVTALRSTLERSAVLVDRLDATVLQNSDNIDETLENVRISTENLRMLTDTLKRSPASIIRGIKMKERKPGGEK